MRGRRVVVIGNGMAGCRFVQELLAADVDRALDVTVVGDEPGGAYNRTQLSLVLAGSRPAELLSLAEPEWYAAHGVRLRAEVAAAAVDRTARVVRLADGTELGYDIVVLATGSAPVLPDIRGTAGIAGVVPFRTLADCRRIDELASGGGPAVVLGAGVLGLEAARALAGRGVAVTLVHRGPRLMERELDADASSVLHRTMRELGVRVAVDNGVTAVRTEAGRLQEVDLADGSTLPAALLMLCCGVRPRLELARAAGLAVARGVVVDNRLRSVTDPRVLAIGECAEHLGRTYGLVAPAWEQARIAAAVVARPDREASYVGSATITRLKADGVELASLGESTALDDEDGGGTEVVSFRDRQRGVYQKLVVRDDRLVGAILLGDTRMVGTLTQLYERGGAVPADRAGLLVGRRSGTPALDSPLTLPARATICHCNGVTKATLCDAWQDGARSARELCSATRAATGCGTCRSAVEGIADWLAAADAGTDELAAQEADDPIEAIA